MLALTEAAAAAVGALVESAGFESGGLRIGPGAAAGVDEGVELTIVEGPLEGDRIVVVGGARVFVDPAAEAVLGESVLDAVLDEDGVHFGLVEHGDAGDHVHA